MIHVINSVVAHESCAHQHQSVPSLLLFLSSSAAIHNNVQTKPAAAIRNLGRHCTPSSHLGMAPVAMSPPQAIRPITPPPATPLPSPPLPSPPYPLTTLSIQLPIHTSLVTVGPETCTDEGRGKMQRGKRKCGEKDSPAHAAWRATMELARDYLLPATPLAASNGLSLLDCIIWGFCVWSKTHLGDACTSHPRDQR